MATKRIFDIVCAGFGLILLMPVFAMLVLWIKIDTPGPVFFRQPRVGLNGSIFQIIKFRTMRWAPEMSGTNITTDSDVRITRSGRFLRMYKLDELPQLFNVLVGDMSMVGPRPEMKEYVAQYPEQTRKKVLSVRPGITSPASLLYRDESTLLSVLSNPEEYYIHHVLPDKLKYNVRYVCERSMKMDVALILRTLESVLVHKA